MPEGIRVICYMKACAFYEPNPKSHTTIICTHSEKRHYLNRLPCPLYRLDWQKSAAANEKQGT